MNRTPQFRCSLRLAILLALAAPTALEAQSVIAGPSASGAGSIATTTASGTSTSTGTATSAGTGTATGGGAVPGTAGGTGTGTPAATASGATADRVPAPTTTPGTPGSVGDAAIFGPEGSTLRTNQPTGAYIAADNARLQGSQAAQNFATQGGFGAPLNNAAAAASREVATFDTGQSAASVGNIRDNVSFGPVTPGANATVISAQTAVANPQNAVGNTGAINDQNLRANQTSLGNQLNFTNQSVLNQNGLQTGLGTASNPVVTPSGTVQTTPGRQGVLLAAGTTATSEQAARQNATLFVVTPVATPTQTAASTGTGTTSTNTSNGTTNAGATSGNTTSAGTASNTQSGSGAGTAGTIAGTSAAVSRSVNVVGYGPSGDLDPAALQSQGITLRGSSTSAAPEAASGAETSAPASSNTSAR